MVVIMSIKSLDSIIERMTDAVEKSEEEIFRISEQSEKEYIAIKEELEKTKILVQKYIIKSDEYEKKVRVSRKKLSEVSKNFADEEKIRKVYDYTHKLQTKLAVIYQEEKSLRQKRDELERRLVQLDKTLEHAHNLSRKVSVISSFLHDDFKEMNRYIKSAYEKQQIGLKIIEAQEQERKRVSREIHDGPAQSLANILVRSEIVDLSFRDGDIEAGLKEMQAFRKSIRQSLHEVRRIIYDLRPMALDDLGLFPTIKKHISTVSDYHDVNIELSLEGKGERLQTHYEVAIFRLIQEGLQNAIKHADATTIFIRLAIQKNNICLTIKDDGVGFDINKPKREDSYGIIGMKERVDILDGEIEIHSEINKGTTIWVHIPYKDGLQTT